MKKGYHPKREKTSTKQWWGAFITLLLSLLLLGFHLYNKNSWYSLIPITAIIVISGCTVCGITLKECLPANWHKMFNK